MYQKYTRADKNKIILARYPESYKVSPAPAALGQLSKPYQESNAKTTGDYYAFSLCSLQRSKRSECARTVAAGKRWAAVLPML